MSFDVGFTLGMDDSDFNRAMSGAENSVSRLGSRVGGFVKSQTRGFSVLRSGMLSIGMAVGVVGGALGAVASVYREIETSAERSKLAALDHADAMRSIRESVEKLEALLSSSGDPIGDRYDSIRKQFEQQIADLQRTSTTRSIDAMDLGSQIAALTSFRRIREGMIDLFTGSDRSLQATIYALNEQNAAEAAILKLKKLQVAAIEEAEKAERARQEATLTQEYDLDLLRLSGDQLEENIYREGQLTAERRRRIQEISGTDQEMLARLMELEDRRHRLSMEHIRREAAEKAKQQKEAEEREKKRAEQLQFEADLLEQNYEVERLRLEGREKEADDLERKLEHQRKIRDLEQREGLDDEQRRRLIEAERRNYELRNKAALAERGMMAEERRSRLADGGFAQSSLVARQTFGTFRSQAPTITSHQEWARKIGESMRQDVRELLRLARDNKIDIRLVAGNN